MNLYRARKIGGMGWGPTPIPSGVQDGLEVTLISLSRAVPANFAQDDQANIEAAYWVAAIAELTIARDSGFKPVGNKTKADWHQKASLVRLEALRFAKAAASKDAKVIQTSAKAITNACNQCHEVYRD
jgi:hypothetical protein